MKKKAIFAVGCILLLFLFCGFGTLAEEAAGTEEKVWVWDQAGLLTEEEATSLNELCAQIAKAHELGVSVVTVNDFEGEDINEWQRRIYAEKELGVGEAENGVMLAVSMSEHDWGIVAFGDAENVFTEYCRESMAELFLDDLSDGNYYSAFSTYIKFCNLLMAELEKEQADPYSAESSHAVNNLYTENDWYTGSDPYTGNEPYSSEGPYGEPSGEERVPIPLIIVAAFVISLIVSLLIVLTWKKNMNTRVQQKGAAQYYKRESFSLTQKTDMFLYHTISRKARPKAENTGHQNKPRPSGGMHSGGMHSGGSGTRGKF